MVYAIAEPPSFLALGPGLPPRSDLERPALSSFHFIPCNLHSTQSSFHSPHSTHPRSELEKREREEREREREERKRAERRNRDAFKDLLAAHRREGLINAKTRWRVGGAGWGWGVAGGLCPVAAACV